MAFSNGFDPKKWGEKVQRQIDYAKSRALNKLANQAKNALVAQGKSEFAGGSTTYTDRAVKVEYSTKTNLRARVFIADQAQGRASPLALLGQQWLGGPRGPKVMEMMFRQAGLITASEYVVPATGLRRDARGNNYPSDLKTIFAALKIGNAKVTKRSRSKLKGTIFWADGTGKLKKGAWLQKPGRAGVSALLLVTTQPKYRRRIDMLATVKRVVAANWQRNFDEAMAEAMRTAK